MLVVDDEPFIRMVAIDALEGEGIIVLEAGDAEEAVELLNRHPEVDLLFTDINMPGLDGVKLAERAIKLRPQIRLIVASGREYRTDQSLPDNGKFLPKPYGPAQLVDLVQRELSAVRG
ncbi:MAG: response regulator [Rhizorhabdus sp.]